LIITGKDKYFFHSACPERKNILFLNKMVWFGAGAWEISGHETLPDPFIFEIIWTGLAGLND